MGSKRSEAVKALLELEQVAADFRRTLRTSETRFRRVRKRLEDGMAIATALDSAHAAQYRAELDREVKALEQARHRFKRASIALGLEECASIAQMGRLWGMTRQRAAQLLSEAKVD